MQVWWLSVFSGCTTDSPPPPSPPPPPPSSPAPAPVAPAPAGPTLVRVLEPGAGHVYAVGDLHGDLDNAIAALHLAGLVDADGHWTGGKTTLVQTGDTTDRGPDSRQILALLRQLETEAAQAGGKVVALLGNHEVMNLRGDLRYVDPGDTAAYGGEQARQQAFSPQGEDGRWLRTKDAVAKVGRTVFVHGGVHPDFATKGLDALNAAVRAAIDVPTPDPVLGETGPLWYRGYVQDPPETACPLLSQALAALEADRMVVGHTTRRDGRVEARCEGALVVIDIGISDHYGGHLGIIELREGKDAWTVTPGGPRDLPDP
jgi:hypothetical protein